MQKLLRKKEGFTLIELMIVVAIIGILAAIALPAFIGYVRRSKTSEATSNLKSLFTGATQYYSSERTGQGINPGATGSCRVANAGPLPAAVSDQKQTFDFGANASFAALGFSISDPFYYQYQLTNSDGACGAPMAGAIFSFNAMGDLDNDMTVSNFELAIGVNANNELFRSPGFFTQNELE